MDAVQKRIAEITARAKSRGLSAKPSANYVQVVAPTPTPAKPRTPIDNAITRRPICAWLDIGGDWKQRDKRDRLQRVGCRVAGWLIARALGDEWHHTVDNAGCHSQHVHIVHKSGFRIWMHHRYETPDGMWTFSACDCRHNDKIGSINASMRKTPAQLADDVSRRLLGQGAIASYKAKIDDERQRRVNQVEARQAMVFLARSIGGEIAPEHWHHRSESHTTKVGYGGEFIDVDGDRCRADGVYLQAKETSSGWCLKIQSHDLATLSAVANFAKEIAV